MVSILAVGRIKFLHVKFLASNTPRPPLLVSIISFRGDGHVSLRCAFWTLVGLLEENQAF